MSGLWAAWLDCCAPSPAVGLTLVIASSAASYAVAKARSRRAREAAHRRKRNVQMTPFDRR